MDPRRIILWLPALILAVLIAVWGALAQWSAGMRNTSEALRRQLQSVRMEKPILSAIQAERNARLAGSAAQKHQGVAYAVMEDTLRKCGLGDNVRQLKPELRELDLYVEETLSLRITQLDRSQVARFLYESQKAMPEMTVDSLSMRRNSNGFIDIDAVFLVTMPK